MTLVEVLAVIGSILAPVAGVATLYVNRLREQDKLAFDADMKLLQKSIARCEVDCKTASESLASERQRREVAEMKVARMEGESKSMEREIQELREQNRELRDRVYGGKHT